jgi:hypothetical protein
MVEDRKFIFAAFACGLAVMLIVAGGVVYSNMPELHQKVILQRQVDNSQPDLNYTQTALDAPFQSSSDPLENAYRSL